MLVSRTTLLLLGLPLLVLGQTGLDVDSLAKAADEKIDFVPHHDLHDWIGSSGFRFAFYGASWCKHCKRLTPKWLKLQQGVKKSADFRGIDLLLGKIDCSTPEDGDFCMDQGADGFPTVFFYHNGVRVEEYPGELKTKAMAVYLRDKIKALGVAQTQTTPQATPQDEPETAREEL
ncbi:hypothetical protein HDV03_003327 [Kappamyces sp. JEL0829]|nr:hypothetical protein HDV03_003327 [Kappamyces sp. JEL0829]